jgi:hypothetical protein
MPIDRRHGRGYFSSPGAAAPSIEEAAMVDPVPIDWLLDSDPALRWQVERDILRAPPATWEVTRARIATEGFGARLLALQDPDGQWAGGAFFPGGFDFDGPEAADGAGQPWTATTWTLKMLHDWGLDAGVLRDRRTAELLAENCRWEYDDLPYRGGEVDCCNNAWTLATGLWLGADVAGIVDPGRVWFEVDVPAGEPSKWLTLYATRVLDWWDGAA